MKIDLFKLHDKRIDDSARKFIVVSGKNLKQELSKIIVKLQTKGISRYRLFKDIKKKLKISDPTAQRLVYLKREWYPLVFIEYLLKLGGILKFDFQENIEFIKSNQPPEVKLKASRHITEELCKIAGAHAADGTMCYGDKGSIYVSIVDRHRENLEAYSEWVWKVFGKRFGVKKPPHAKEMWQISFKNKVIGRYLNKIFGFPYGPKFYNVNEPKIIKDVDYRYRKAFAIGFLSFEGGVGIRNEVELTIKSKKMRDSVYEILKCHGLKVTSMKSADSGKLWRLWSNKLTKHEASAWMDFFEQETEKWLKLYEYVNGFKGKVNSIEDAIKSFSSVFPPQGKTSLVDILNIIKRQKESHRYSIQNETELNSKWAHSLKYYIDLLKMANVIKIEKRKFGEKKSFGSIIRDVYVYNPDVLTWKVPYRSRLKNQVKYVS